MARLVLRLTVLALSIGCVMAVAAYAQGRPGGGRPPRPTQAMLEACSGKDQGDQCSVSGEDSAGICFAPGNRPLACVPEGGHQIAGRGGRPPQWQRSIEDSIAAIYEADTSDMLCGALYEAYNDGLDMTSRAEWTCVNGQRRLVANGIPAHETGSFPSRGNPNRISPQNVTASMTLTPAVTSASGRPIKVPGYALNGVKFDPGTNGACPSSASAASQCDLGHGRGPWRMEALGQDVFDFGEDDNFAHVQPSGAYHYHGTPTGLLSAAAAAGEEMALVGWAADGFPIYARYGFASALDGDSPLSLMQPSYRLKETPDPGRPDIDLIPMGAFTQDYEYVAGLGDLDECNGRFAATPDYPEGIYHYYTTGSFPFVQRCVKGEALSYGPVGQRPNDQRPPQRRRGRRP